MVQVTTDRLSYQIYHQTLGCFAFNLSFFKHFLHSHWFYTMHEFNCFINILQILSYFTNGTINNACTMNAFHLKC